VRPARDLLDRQNGGERTFESEDAGGDAVAGGVGVDECALEATAFQ
jgi:hypothetical protein